MSPVLRSTIPMHRYGEADFDAEYLHWGLHDRCTQLREAESVLDILRLTAGLRILDLACGVGTHAIHWAKKGHAVTGVDISETFVRQAQQSARQEGASAEFLVADVRSLDYREQFDVVTWIESSFPCEQMADVIFRALRPGGCFITDVRNPENARTRFRQADWRTWREEGGIFYLERHEVNPASGKHEDVWITIDPQREVIEEKANVADPAPSLADVMRALGEAGFRPVELRTMEGEAFLGGEEPHWLWLVAGKP